MTDTQNGLNAPKQSDVLAIRAALEAAGVEFVPENGGGGWGAVEEGARMSGCINVRGHTRWSRDAHAYIPEALFEFTPSKGIGVTNES